MIALHNEPEPVRDWINNELADEMKKEGALRFSAGEFVELLQMLKAQAVSHGQAREILALMSSQGGTPQKWAAEQGFKQVSDPAALKKWVDEVMSEQAASVARYQQGEEKLFGFLVGQAMKKSKGSGNPQLISDLLKQALAARK